MKKTDVKFCGANWEIREVKNKTLEDKIGSATDGMVDFDNQRAYISSELHIERKQLAWIHEMLHIGYDRAGYQRDDEAPIRAIEHSVHELIYLYMQYFHGVDVDGHN